MNTELTIKGDIEVLRLLPGDTIVVTVDDHVTSEGLFRLKEQVVARFPDYEVVVMHGARLSVQRAAAA